MNETLSKDNLLHYTHTGHPLTNKQELFIINYIASGNGSYAAEQAGYLADNETDENGKIIGKTIQSGGTTIASIAKDLLSQDYIREEILYRRKVLENAKIAQATEVLQFYTSVMRGELLDQFGIEASLDTRLKAANELAKHQIEIPLRLEQKKSNNAMGSIQINFIPRKTENV